MIKRWLTYGITLLLAFVFYGVYTGYLSLFTLAVVLLFPLFSLLVSLWPMHAARVFEPVLKSRCVAGNRPAPLLHIRPPRPSRCRGWRWNTPPSIPPSAVLRRSGS